MPPDDDADDAFVSGPPLPPDDRLWRHPSELGSHGVEQPNATGSRSARTWPVAVVAGMAGAVLAMSGVALVAVGVASDQVLASTSTSAVAALDHAVASVTAEQAAQAAVDSVTPSLARLDSGNRTLGTAIVLRQDGYLVTAAHVVSGVNDLVARLADGRSWPAEVVAEDRETDVAVLKVGASGLQPATLGSALHVYVGQLAIGVAAPAPGEKSAAPVSVGIVRGLGRHVKASTGDLHDLIQTDAALPASAAGGPIVDASGAVIGMIAALGESASEASNDPSSGPSFATPIDVAGSVAFDLIEWGHTRPVWLGIHGTDLDKTSAKEYRVNGGAVVREVVDQSPAKLAGLADFDVILSVDGVLVRSMSALVVALRTHHPGDSVVVSYLRGGVRRSMRVTLADRPAAA